MTAFQSRLKEAPDGSLYVRAPAKINLFLHITGRRDDGYHVLESLFAFTKHGDLLNFKEADDFAITFGGANAAAMTDLAAEDNLVAKSARALAKAAGKSLRGEINLEKNLPLASGLGGGSSNAAATLIGLNHLWDCGFSEEQLTDLALDLGADVPSCLKAESQIVRGIGEKLEPVDLSWSAGVVMVNPGKPVPTPEVFKGFKTFREQRGLPPFDVAVSDIDRVVKDIPMLDVLTSNSLQDPACQLCPDIMEVERFLRLNSQQELLRMSGSGATVFALYHDKQAAEAVAHRVRKHAPHWWVMADEIS